MAIWSKRITEKAAFWGMLTGLAFNVVPKLFEFIGLLELPSYLNPVIIGGVASLIVTVLVSRRTTPGEEEVRYLAGLHERPDDEIGLRRTRTTLIAPAVLLVVNGLLLPAVLTLNYVIPYQRATGTLLPNGSLDWATGEMALMLSWSVIWIGVGLFAMRYIRRAYAPVSS
jgi:sodium/pantothenate symporter